MLTFDGQLTAIRHSGYVIQLWSYFACFSQCIVIVLCLENANNGMFGRQDFSVLVRQVLLLQARGQVVVKLAIHKLNTRSGLLHWYIAQLVMSIHLGTEAIHLTQCVLHDTCIQQDFTYGRIHKGQILSQGTVLPITTSGISKALGNGVESTGAVCKHVHIYCQ